jgi:hypothetical protein
MNIPIWPGSSSFFPGDTPFGFYDNDYQFQQDADKFAKFAAQRMGYPLVEIELQDINLYTALEDAVTTYGNELYAYQVADNLLTFQGNPLTIENANNKNFEKIQSQKKSVSKYVIINSLILKILCSCFL